MLLINARLRHRPGRYRARIIAVTRPNMRLVQAHLAGLQKYRLNKILAKVSSSPVLVRGTF